MIIATDLLSDRIKEYVDDVERSMTEGVEYNNDFVRSTPLFTQAARLLRLAGYKLTLGNESE